MAFSCAIGATVWLKISWPERKTGCDVWEVPWVPIAPYKPANELTITLRALQCLYQSVTDFHV